MEKQQSLLLKRYSDLLFRWKYLLIILLLCSLPIGLFLYLQAPKIYQARSLLSYQQQKISPNNMSPDVKARTIDIVSSISPIVLSRTNLEKIIQNFGLYPKLLEQLPMEDVIEVMKKNINISPSKRGDTFSIRYRGQSPGKVARVTNDLAAKFIEENLKYREERATETSSYTSDELEMAKVMMDRKESSMRDYKLKYYNEMPDQRESNVSRLIALQEQYAAKQTGILDLERTRLMVQEQIASRKKLIASDIAIVNEKAAAGRGMSDVKAQYMTKVEQLKRAQGQLASLQVKYTDKHPEIRRVKMTISKLEQQIGVTQDSGETPPQGKTRLPLENDLLDLRNQLKDIDFSVKVLGDEKVQLRKRIDEHEKWVSAAPVREAEWSALTREYDELKRHYDYLVAQDLQAKSMLNLERRQKGSQFKVEDPARIPEKPIKPNFMSIMGKSVVLALGMGGVIVVFFHFLDGSFRDPDEIESYLNVPVASTVAYFPTAKEKRIKTIKTVMVNLLLCLGFVSVVALFWYAWHQGKIVL